MRQVRRWMRVVILCWAAAATGSAPPDARLREAQAAFDEAGTLWDAGRYEEALARGEQALALRETVLGGVHPDVATGLDWLGAHHFLRGNPVRAEPLLQRALAIREAALGQNHPEVAQTLHALGNLYTAQWWHARAEPLHARALAIREAALGKNHPSVAESLLGLAEIRWQQGLYARGKPLAERALAIREAALGKNHLLVAEALYWLATCSSEFGLSTRAEPLAARALAIQEAALGKNHPLVARSLQRLAFIYSEQGLFARARPLDQRALAILEAEAGNNPPDVADSLTRLALVYAREEPIARAEPLHARALAIREAALGKGHPLVADSLYYLASISLSLGWGARAMPLLQRALAIREAVHGDNHPDVAASLQGLSYLYMAQGSYGQARLLSERVLAMHEAALGKDHPRVAFALHELAVVHSAQGLYDQAEPLFARALTTLEAGLGKDHPYLAQPLDDLATLYAAQGLYRRAESLRQRALAFREASLGKNHPLVAGTLARLASDRLAQHRLDEALPLLTHAFALNEQHLRQGGLGLSEAHLENFLQALLGTEDFHHAVLRAHPNDARVRRLALGTTLLLRGRSVEESANISRAVYRGLGARDRDTFERLRALRTQLARLSLQGPGPLPPAAYQQRMEALTEQGNALEADLAQRSAPLRALTTLPSLAEIVGRVASALPRDAALVEFIACVDRPLVLKHGTDEYRRNGQRRYLALVLFPDGTTQFQDLGAAEPIDLAASRLRDALANRDATFLASAQALYQLAFQPLLPLLGNTRRLFLSPDGQLALVPFAALHDGHQFLVDTFDLTYVPSGRSLLPRPEEAAPPESVVVLADPDFSAARLPAPPTSQAESPGLATRSLPDGRFFSSLRAHLAARGWAPTPLPGTRQEAEAIQRLLPQARLFLGAEATRQRLLQLPAPGILHVATHGFFLEDAPSSPDSRAVAHFGPLGGDALAFSPPDPLLRSGLVLAGASTPAPSGASPSAPPPPDNALVTALELTGLDLWGTQLVVLSACDTGRGDVKPGQGVYGLRRAFLVAGAETVVMSLWKVNDETTRSLMEAYYRHLLAGLGRATALREAMLELRRTWPHPHHWAPFIAMGRDTPLRLPVPLQGEVRLQEPGLRFGGPWP